MDFCTTRGFKVRWVLFGDDLCIEYKFYMDVNVSADQYLYHYCSFLP